MSNPSPGYSFKSMIPFVTSSVYNLSRRITISGGASSTIPPRSVITLVASLDAGNLTNINIEKNTAEKAYNIYPNPTIGIFTTTSEG